MSVVIESHIVIDENGVAKVAGTGYKVRLLAGEHWHRGYSAEQLTQAHPGLTLAQAHSVLAYYYEHKAEMDADMDRRAAEMERMRGEAGEPPIATRLKAEGQWPYPFSLTDEQVRAEDVLDKLNQ